MEILKSIIQAVIKPFGDDKTTVFVRVRYHDDTEDDKLIETSRDEIETLTAELVDRIDVKEAWVFEQVHHHKKACASRDRSSVWSSGLGMEPAQTHI